MLELVKYDLKHGLKKFSNIFLIVSVTVICDIANLFNILNAGSLSGDVYKCSFLDYYIYSMRGMEYFDITKAVNFQIPIYWFVVYMGIAYFIGYYTKENLQSVGNYMMIKSKSRVKWWYSKCIWCFVSVFSIFAVGFGSVLIYCIINRIEISFSVNYNVLKLFCNQVVFMNKSELIISSTLLPFVLTYAISLIQILISIVFDAVASFAFVCINYVLAAYYTSPFLLGNYLMWFRNNKVCNGGGYDLNNGLLVSIIMILLVILIGASHMDKKDLL